MTPEKFKEFTSNIKDDNAHTAKEIFTDEVNAEVATMIDTRREEIRQDMFSDKTPETDVEPDAE